MKIEATNISGVNLLSPKVFADNRGSFMEIWNNKTFDNIGIPDSFIQDNVSTSTKGVLRCVHTQLIYPQSKIVSCLCGCIFDVAVDCRVNSPSYGQWHGEILSA
jgi:dTDP-4-dehydrorhamnose 3,5-epimerase